MSCRLRVKTRRPIGGTLAGCRTWRLYRQGKPGRKTGRYRFTPRQLLDCGGWRGTGLTPLSICSFTHGKGTRESSGSGKLVWVRIGNCRKQVLLEAFRVQLPRIVSELEAGNQIVELR
jgi:hypothetical protein